MRAVIGDHILFDECIESFREDISNNFQLDFNSDEERVSYIMTDFEINDTINIKDVCIYKSKRVFLPSAYSGFISKVILPKWVRYNSESLFTIALSSVISFCTGRVVKSPRDNYFHNREISEDELISLAIQNPILVAGPGAVNSYVSKSDLEEYIKEVDKTITLLWKIPIKKYKEFMYAIRLATLSIYNLREDFALSYYLMCSSIESIAQRAIKIKSQKHPCEAKWEERAKSDPEFNMIFKEYKKERNKNKYLSEKFKEFILKYCPVTEWNKLKHPMEERFNGVCSSIMDNKWITEKKWYEIYPDDLNQDQIKDLLSQTYNYRSRFTHQGINPPHEDPDDNMNRFFQIINKYEGNTFNRVILINYNLLSFIDRKSIIKYLEETSCQ